MEALREAGMADSVTVTSAGTGDWHLGQGADHRAKSVAAAAGLSLNTHQARQFTAEDFAINDLVLALDYSHLQDLQAIAPSQADAEKVRLFREFDGVAAADADLEVADPYYGDRRDFEITLEQVQQAARGVVEYVRQELGARTRAGA